MIVYLTYDIWTMTYESSGFYNISVMEKGLTTSTAMLGKGIDYATIKIEKVSYPLKLDRDKVILTYIDGDIEIY